MALRTRQQNGFDTALSSWDMAVLKYLPLVQAREIRLIDIHPGGFADKLRIHVYHSTLNEADSQPFDALSYVWGSPDDPVMVDIDFASTEGVVCNFNLYITQNLAAALKQLRYPDVPRKVWADAICINQSDYEERAQQVLMMGDIYRFARKVVAFIGPEDDDSSYAFELIQQLSEMVEVDFGTGHVKPSPGGSSEPDWANMQRDLPFHHRELIAIHHLLLREWFERLWIRQEIGIGGHRGVLRCGNNELSWLSFCKAIFVIMRKPIIADVFDTAQYQTFRDRLGKVDTVALFSMRAFRFTNLRRQIGMSLCSDERDRIYAVLGQLRETDQIGIIPDYTKTISDVYVDATQKHIRHFNNLSILCQCELRHQSRTTPALSLPSWVPDWSRPMHSSSVHGVTPPLFNILPAIESMDDKLIRAYGVRCDTVRRVVTVDEELLQNGSDASTAQMIRKLLSEVDNDDTVKGTYRSPACILEAYCRTLWLNNFVDRWHPPVSHEPPYEDCLALVRTLLNSDSRTKDPTTLPNAARCLRGARDACRGRALFVSEEGLLGMAPESIAARDEVCALFGSYKPTALHPIGDYSSKMAQQYHVVGECYLDGMMQGEPVLGKLPEHVHELLDAKALMGLRSAGFIDARTKLILKEDPRMEPFLTGLVEKGLLHSPTQEEVERRGAMDILINAGVPMRIFDLV